MIINKIFLFFFIFVLNSCKTNTIDKKKHKSPIKKNDEFIQIHEYLNSKTAKETLAKLEKQLDKPKAIWPNGLEYVETIIGDIKSSSYLIDTQTNIAQRNKIITLFNNSEKKNYKKKKKTTQIKKIV